MITQIRRKITQIVVSGILALSINQASAYCFNISPNRMEISLYGGREYEGFITVKNTEDRELHMSVRIEDWARGVEGKPKSPDNSFGWLQINPVGFELKAGNAQKVSYKIVVPKGRKGELNAMIFIEGKPAEVKEGSIGINTSIGVPIYVMIKGTEKYRAELEDLLVSKNSPLELAVKIKNSGNVHIRPAGSIEIKNRKGEAVFICPLNEYNYPILPNSSRTLEIRSDKRLERGDYTAYVKMGFGNKKYSKKITLKIE